ncbi:hypothetical protein CDL12_10451 [Handroanthus impetiginosus]|uniref:Uncharacterized protein n=1 Tax=Handroanthus impetiginosus TaxID=429701 RepID=A0A2G9HHB8_9LAMI|nr:hypothetical protein CDL12_10451 [Handroanthus impetiginosus]
MKCAHIPTDSERAFLLVCLFFDNFVLELTASAVDYPQHLLHFGSQPSLGTIASQTSFWTFVNILSIHHLMQTIYSYLLAIEQLLWRKQGGIKCNPSITHLA